MNSVIRTIDLLAKILAPILTGVIMAGGSHAIGATFIAGWNLISLVAEFFILRKVYRDNPALKIKVSLIFSKQNLSNKSDNLNDNNDTNNNCDINNMNTKIKITNNTKIYINQDLIDIHNLAMVLLIRVHATL